MWKVGVWKLKSPSTFQKGSPLVPFFKYAYGKLRQTGTLTRIKQKWEKKEISANCGSNQLRPISFNKIVSLIVLLLLGMSIAFLISVIEIFYKRRAEAKIIDKVAVLERRPKSTAVPKIFDLQLWLRWPKFLKAIPTAIDFFHGFLALKPHPTQMLFSVQFIHTAFSVQKGLSVLF